MSSAHPYMRFFTTDYRADPAVQRCSWAARGLWVDMLCIMHENGGYLSVGGVPLTVAELARMAGGPEDEAHALLADLERAKVFSRDEDGTIYSRRIIRDIERSERGRENGKLGGNPRLREGLTPPHNPNGKGRVKAKPKPHARMRTRPESTSDFLTEEVDRARRGRPDAACASKASASVADQETELQTARRKLKARLASQPAHFDRVLAGSKTANDPLAYLKGCLKEKLPAKPPPEKPPDSVVVPSRFVRQGSDEWQRLKAGQGGRDPVVTMHHGDAGTWVRSA